MVVQLTRRVRLFAGRTGGGYPSSENCSPPTAALRPAVSHTCSVRECCIACLSPGCRGTSAVVSFPVSAPPPSPPTLRDAHYHRQLPSPPRTLVVRVPGLLFLPEFLLLSTVKGPAPTADSVYHVRQTARAMANCFGTKGTGFGPPFAPRCNRLDKLNLSR